MSYLGLGTLGDCFGCCGVVLPVVVFGIRMVRFVIDVG